VSAAPFSCTRLDGSLAEPLARLFDRVGSACFCRYFHFEGDKNAWQLRLAHEPEANRRELFDHAREPVLTGVVATLPDGAAIGWMKLEAAASLPKLYAQRTYRALPCFEGPRAGVLTVGCVLVDPEWRRRGVARALLNAGIGLARAERMSAIEAFPRRAEGAPDEQLFTGPLSLFTSEGFEIVSEQTQYPVLRLVL
jgi:GNAT superfamily N-acetyltransferase